MGMICFQVRFGGHAKGNLFVNPMERFSLGELVGDLPNTTETAKTSIKKPG
jgi:hypothetical protein